MRKILENKKLITVFRILFAAILILLALYLVYDMRNISVKNILFGKTDNIFLSVVIVLFIYALKSVTVFIPIIMLQLIAGSLFDQWLALSVNFAGIFICYTLPYLLGKRAGENHMQGFLEKYPRLEKFMQRQQKNAFYSALFLRCVGFLPGDLVSMYYGTLSAPYVKYICGSLLGSAPRIIAVTLVGTSINDPSSPQFIASVSVTVILAVFSSIGYLFYNRKR